MPHIQLEIKRSGTLDTFEGFASIQMQRYIENVHGNMFKMRKMLKRTAQNIQLGS